MTFKTASKRSHIRHRPSCWSAGVDGPWPADPTEPLGQDRLEWIQVAALARWKSAGLSDSALEQLEQVRFEIADLSGNLLGLAHGDSIQIDRVNLKKHVFRCCDPTCQVQGNALDLWALAHDLPLYEAALHLANTFHLQLHRTREEATRKRVAVKR